MINDNDFPFFGSIFTIFLVSKQSPFEYSVSQPPIVPCKTSREDELMYYGKLTSHYILTLPHDYKTTKPHF